MPGCDFTRRDFLRWSAVALATPIALRTEFLSSVAAASTRRDDVSPANLELVTLTEDRAVITWYTGYTEPMTAWAACVPPLPTARCIGVRTPGA